MTKRLVRPLDGRTLAGVCAAFANYFGIDATLVRVLWVLFSLSGGFGVLLYIICALIIPSES